MLSVLQWLTGSAASVSWENYDMADEHMHTANLFLDNYKNVFFYENSECSDTKYLRVFCNHIRLLKENPQKPTVMGYTSP
jgi:hypothetical protein